jgi:hypothetical protein
MSHLVGCDRCGAVTTHLPGRGGWSILPDPDSELDPLFGGPSGTIDVCPRCLTPEEAVDRLLRQIEDGAPGEWIA